MVTSSQESPGRWDLWLLGIGVVVLLIVWLVDPFFERPLPTRPPPKGSPPPVTRTNPPEDWFRGERGNLFQERIVATPQYDKGGVTFDLAEEKQRLRTWLNTNDHRNTLRANPLAISAYHALDKDQGGRLSKHLQWFPHKVEVDPTDGTRYETPYSQSALPRFDRSRLHEAVVPLFTLAELGKGPTTMKGPLVEYVPVNMHERGFTLVDLDLTECWASVDRDGRPVFHYRFKPASDRAFANFSQEYIGFESALIIDGYLISAPWFRTRITGRGVIAMRTEGDTHALVEGIRARLPGR